MLIIGQPSISCDVNAVHGAGAAALSHSVAEIDALHVAACTALSLRKPSKGHSPSKKGDSNHTHPHGKPGQGLSAGRRRPPFGQVLFHFILEDQCINVIALDSNKSASSPPIKYSQILKFLKRNLLSLFSFFLSAGKRSRMSINSIVFPAAPSPHDVNVFTDQLILYNELNGLDFLPRLDIHVPRDAAALDVPSSTPHGACVPPYVPAKRWPALLTDNYRILNLIGRGATGHVFKAFSKRSHVESLDGDGCPSHARRGGPCFVAIKCIEKGKLAARLLDDDKRDMTSKDRSELSEISILKRLKYQPNVVRYIEHYEDAERVYLVTELAGSEWKVHEEEESCGGSSSSSSDTSPSTGHSLALEECQLPPSSFDLFEFINECQHKLSEPLIHYIFKQIYDCVLHMKTHHNIIHRDLKDENILIDQNYHIKLIDFGSAIYYTLGAKVGFKGTLQFAPPEVLQLGSAKDIQVKSYHLDLWKVEVWTLGIILYTLFFGENPFAATDGDQASSGASTRLTIPRHSKLISPHTAKQSPLGPWSLITRMLAADPDLRISLEDIQHHSWIVKSTKG